MTPKQYRFVHEYLQDMNAAQAAIRAGYAQSTAIKKAALWVGKSRDSCPINMRHVWDAVQQSIQERNERLKIDADGVLHELVVMLQANIKDAFDEDGKLRPVRDIPPEVLGIIRSMRVTENGSHIQLISKLDILRQIGVHVQVNAFRQDVNVTAQLDVADVMMQARQRKRRQIMAQKEAASAHTEELFCGTHTGPDRDK